VVRKLSCWLGGVRYLSGSRISATSASTTGMVTVQLVDDPASDAVVHVGCSEQATHCTERTDFDNCSETQSFAVLPD